MAKIIFLEKETHQGSCAVWEPIKIRVTALEKGNAANGRVSEQILYFLISTKLLQKESFINSVPVKNFP